MTEIVTTQDPEIHQPVSSGQRYLSLDVLRGMTVALMIVVNSPGSWGAIYAPFEHAKWHGFTLTDLVFPTFLFVVGNAMSFSLKKMDGMHQSKYFAKLFKRSFIIFAIGFLLNYFPFFNFSSEGGMFKDILSVRLLGVLQRIALCYLLAGVLIYMCRKPVALFTLAMLILLIYWGLLYFFGLGNDPYSLETNAVGRLDLWLIPVKNLYTGFGIPFEPEGILSTLPAVVNVIAGYLTGIYIRKQTGINAVMKRLFTYGAMLLLAGLLWDQLFPINKALWTSSYVLFSIGCDLLILASLVAIIDVKQINSWTNFFEAFGKNALFIYILAWVILKVLHLIPFGDQSIPQTFYKDVLCGFLPPKSASLLFAVIYMLLLWLFAWFFDKKKIYVKV